MSEPDPRDRAQPKSSPPTAALPAVPGFTLEGRLGRGAVGTTYRATRASDGQPLALKLVHPNVCARPANAARIEKLGGTLPRIEHAHVARFVGFGALPGTTIRYALSELVSGEPLVQHLQAEGVTLRQVVERFGELLSGLAEAHRQGVLHLGLRPGNAVVVRRADRSPRTTLLDLGLGRLLKPDGPGAAYMATNPSHVRYASPELLEGRELDGRSDLFSVGALLYEVLTGRAAYDSDSTDELIRAITLRDVIPPTSRDHVRPVPRELEAVAMRALRRVPDDRFRSALEMAQALRASLEILAFRADLPLGPGVTSSQPTPPTPLRATMPGDQLPSRTKLWLGLALLAAAGAALFFFSVQRAPTGPQRLDAARAAIAVGQHDQALELLPEQVARGDRELACLRAEALRGLGRGAEAADWLAREGSRRGAPLACPH